MEKWRLRLGRRSRQKNGELDGKPEAFRTGGGKAATDAEVQERHTGGKAHNAEVQQRHRCGKAATDAGTEKT